MRREEKRREKRKEEKRREEKRREEKRKDERQDIINKKWKGMERKVKKWNEVSEEKKNGTKLLKE